MCIRDRNVVAQLGQPMISYICRIGSQEQSRLAELRYHISRHRWCL